MTPTPTPSASGQAAELWPPTEDDPKDVVTIVVTGEPDGYGKQSFWIKWYDGRWRAQHFHAKLQTIVDTTKVSMAGRKLELREVSNENEP